MKKKKRRLNFWIGLGMFLLIGIASWSFYNILNQASQDLLMILGIENFYIQNGIIVAIIFIFLLIIGYTFKDSIKKIIK